MAGRPLAAARPLTAGDLAWLAALPFAIALVAAIVLVAPPLGDALLPGPSLDFWPSLVAGGAIRPEPTEQAAYLLALLAPVLLCATVALLARRAAGRAAPAGPAARLLAPAVLVSQLVLVAALVAFVVVQHRTAFGYWPDGSPNRKVFFTPATIAVAALIAAALAETLRRPALTSRIARLARDTRGRRAAAIALAIALTAAWELTAVVTDGSIGESNLAVAVNIPFWLGETFAVLNGRPPLVDFHSQYAQLWPYALAGVMTVLGTSLGVWSVALATAGGAAMLAILAVLRRVAGSWLLALALYAPFLATSFFTMKGPPEDRYGPANLLSIFPMRCAGPFLLAWLVARHLGGARPRRPALLFGVAGVVVLNNPEFGIPALGAVTAALLWARPPATARSAGRLLAEAAAGLLGALAAVSALTLVVGGSLPHLGWLLEFVRLFGAESFGLLPMTAFGFQHVVYATFAAALVVATVRAAERREDVVLTGLLAWVAVFGLGAGAYFVGRSDPEVLVNLFSPWALALALLLVAAVRGIVARPSRRPQPAELALLVGCGLAVCSLAQLPTPWSQVQRLGERTATPAYHPRAAARWVAQRTRPGEPVLILAPMGHRIAYDAGVVNVSPYAAPESIPSREQLDRALRDAGGRRLLLTTATPLEQDLLLSLRRDGWVVAARGPDGLRELRPPAGGPGTG